MQEHIHSILHRKPVRNALDNVSYMPRIAKDKKNTQGYQALIIIRFKYIHVE